jgi:hypothetical protein
MGSALKRIEFQPGTPDAVMVGGQLLRKPLPPLEPVREIVTWERQSTALFAPMTMGELFSKLPRGVSFDCIKIGTDTSNRLYFDVKKTVQNTFYEEELKVYHAKLAVYELEKKMWEARVEEAKSRERAEIEARFAEIPPVHVSRESIATDEITRDWLLSIDRNATKPVELDSSELVEEEEQEPVTVHKIEMIGERWEDQERANYGLDEMRQEFRERLYGKPEVSTDDGLTIKPSSDE